MTNRVRFPLIVFLTALLFGTSLLALAQDQTPVTLRFAWWGNPTRDERTLKVIELFQEQYPWITIETEPAAWDDYWVLMQSQRDGGNLPDLMQQDYARLQLWVNQEQLLELDEFVTDGTLDFTNVAETNLVGGRINDHLYAVSMGMNSYGIVIDTEAFAQAGLELPQQNWTWEDFEATCLALYEKLDKWCIGGHLADEHMWRSMWAAYGETAYASDGKSLGYSNDQPLVDLLNLTLRLQKTGAIPSRSDDIALGGLINTEPIIEGKAAMAGLWSNQLIALWKMAGEDRQLVMQHTPRPIDGCCSANYIKPSMFLSITSGSTHPHEAALFIDFITNSVAANRILLGERGVPISSVIQDDLKDAVSPAEAETFAFLSRVEKDSSPLPPPDAAVHSTLRDTLYTPIVNDAVLFEEMTPAAAAALFREEANKLLAGQ